MSEHTARNSRAVLIYGITKDGKRFRPSDWVERFCGVLAPYSQNSEKQSIMKRQNTVMYSDLVFPISVNEERVVIALNKLEVIEPMAWTFVKGFITGNNLKVKHLTELEIKKYLS